MTARAAHRRNTQIAVRIDDDLLAQLDHVSGELGVTRGEAARRAMLAGIVTALRESLRETSIEARPRNDVTARPATRKTTAKKKTKTKKPAKKSA